jgi:hypothetical protein
MNILDIILIMMDIFNCLFAQNVIADLLDYNTKTKKNASESNLGSYDSTPLIFSKCNRRFCIFG